MLADVVVAELELMLVDVVVVHRGEGGLVLVVPSADKRRLSIFGADAAFFFSQPLFL